jgi:hypothetical protein
MRDCGLKIWIERVNLYGGHIVFDSTQVNARAGDGGVYILPICNAHNNRSNNDRMITLRDIIAVKLKNYLNY